MVVGASYLECTRDGLLRQVVYLGEREDNRSSGAAKFTPRAIENEAPSCAMISAITSDDSYLQAFSGEKP